MSKRNAISIMMSLGIVVFLSTFAHAWVRWVPPGILVTGSLISQNCLSNVPNPLNHPSVVFITEAITEVEQVCTNPNEHNVYQPGVSGIRTITLDAIDIIQPKDIVDKAKGLACVDVEFELNDYASNEYCVNPNWNYVPYTIAATKVTQTRTYYECVCENKLDTDCCISSVDGSLTVNYDRPIIETNDWELSPVLRNADYTVTEGQYYTCTTCTE